MTHGTCRLSEDIVFCRSESADPSTTLNSPFIEKRRIIFNDWSALKPVKITKPDNTFVDGSNGFRADQSLNTVYLFKGKGELNIEESTDSTRSSDSVQRP